MSFTKDILLLITKHEKIKLVLLSILGAISGVIEFFTLLITVSFISIIIEPTNAIYNISYFGSLTIAIYIIRAIISFIFYYLTNKTTLKIAHSIKYKDLKKNIKLISNKSENIATILCSLIISSSEFLIIFLIYTYLLIKNPYLTIIFSIIFITIGYLLRKKINSNKWATILHKENIYKLQENFELIKKANHENYVTTHFEKKDRSIIKPKALSEALYEKFNIFFETSEVIILIIFLIYFPKDIILTIVLFGLGMFRILSSIRKIFFKYYKFKESRHKLILRWKMGEIV